MKKDLKNKSEAKDIKLKDEKKPANSNLKTAIYWIIVGLVAVTTILYYALDWISAAQNISKYLDAIIRSVMVLCICSILQKISAFLFKSSHKGSQRSQTVSSLLSSIVKYLIAIVAIVIILTLFVEDTSSLFTGIGMLGLVVGLGCNKLISDIVAGIFMVFEGDFQVGDVVVVGGWRGTVKDIGVRTTKIEDAGGNIKILNNSNISDVVNNSKALSLAVCDVGIEYDESIERVENVIQDNLASIKGRIPAIIDGPFYKGIDSLGDSAVVIKIVAKCKEEDKFQTQRDLNREVKILFDKNSIGIPFPQITLSQRVDNNSTVTVHEAKRANKFVDEQKEESKGIEETNN